MSAGHVLVVDDEWDVRLVLGEFLAGRGYEVTFAETGPEALAAIEREELDVVLLDVFMPEMDGAETLRRIVTLHPTLPVIVVTANAEIAMTSKLIALGAADYIPKPFDFGHLDQAVTIQMSARQVR